MQRNDQDLTIRTEWLARPPEARATDQQASDFAWAVADRTDGSNRRYQVVMNLVRGLVGRD